MKVKIDKLYYFKAEKRGPISLYLFFLTAYCLVLSSLLFGCIRVAGKAGYWERGQESGVTQSKQVGFDTQHLVPRSTPEGNIDIAAT